MQILRIGMHDEQVVLRPARAGRRNANLEWQRLEPGDAFAPEQRRCVLNFRIFPFGSPALNQLVVGVALHNGEVALTSNSHDLVRPRSDDAKVSSERNHIERAIAVDIGEHRPKREVETMNVGHDGDAHRREAGSSSL